MNISWLILEKWAFSPKIKHRPFFTRQGRLSSYFTTLQHSPAAPVAAPYFHHCTSLPTLPFEMVSPSLSSLPFPPTFPFPPLSPLPFEMVLQSALFYLPRLKERNRPNFCLARWLLAALSWLYQSPTIPCESHAVPTLTGLPTPHSSKLEDKYGKVTEFYRSLPLSPVLTLIASAQLLVKSSWDQSGLPVFTPSLINPPDYTRLIFSKLTLIKASALIPSRSACRGPFIKSSTHSTLVKDNYSYHHMESATAC